MDKTVLIGLIVVGCLCVWMSYLMLQVLSQLQLAF